MTVGEHEHTIVGYSLVKGIGDGEPIASERFSVGGHEWVSDLKQKPSPCAVTRVPGSFHLPMDSQAIVKNLALAIIHAPCSWSRHTKPQMLVSTFHLWHPSCLEEAMLATRLTNLMQATAPHNR